MPKRKSDKLIVNLPNLRKLLTEVCGLADLKVICFDLGVNYELVVPENAPTTVAVMAIITYLDNRNRLLDLVYRSRREFPDAGWAEVVSDFTIATKGISEIGKGIRVINKYITTSADDVDDPLLIRNAPMLQSPREPFQRYLLRAALVRIGRDVSGPSDICLPEADMLVSREHARLILEGSTWWLEDQSRNGTLVNGRLIKNRRIPLGGGERIQIGNSFDYLFGTRQAIRRATTAGVSSFEVNNAVGLPLSEIPPNVKGLWISPSAAIWRDGTSLAVNLSRTEYRLLMYLMQRSGDVCKYEDVILAVWGNPRDKKSLNELIYRVHRKIEPSPKKPIYLVIQPELGVVLYSQSELTKKKPAPPTLSETDALDNRSDD